MPIRQYYERDLPKWIPGKNTFCPFHDDDKASLSIDLAVGATYCHGCQHKSSSVVGYHEQRHKLSFEDALKDLCNTWVEPLVPEKELKTARENLLGNQEVMAHVQNYMGLTRESVEKMGWGLSADGIRIWIPIENEVGWIVDVRKYYWRRPLPKDEPKTISYRTGYGGARVWPHSALEMETVFFMEGERDTALIRQDTFNGITLTTGGKTALRDLKEYFRDKHVIFVPHMNDKVGTGQLGVKDKIEELKGVAATIKVVELDVPKEIQGGDYSDYRLGQRGSRPHSVDEFRQLVDDSAVVYRRQVQQKQTRGEYKQIELRDIQKAENFERNVAVKAHVIGKSQSPWLLPKVFTARCDATKMAKCEDCPLKASGGSRTEVLEETDRTLVGLAGASDASLHVALRRYCGVKQQCQFEFATSSTHHVGYVSLVPELDVTREDSVYLNQPAYTVNCNVEANRGYEFRGYVTSDPSTQAAVFVITHAEPIQDSVDKFALEPEDISKLKVFKTDRIGRTFAEQAKVASINTTKIRGRDDLWLLCELAFHSVQGFMFGEELVPKGWLDVLVVGDTRCGKGYTAERLVHYYGLGEVVSSENCSHAGLVGGMLQVGDRWQIVWGKIPLGDRRLVVLDEAKSLSEDDIGRMSRLRSEGIAEVSKIQTERTLARTRLLWLTNTREGRLMKTYDYGVNAIPEFAGHAEDIARFDLAMTVALSEVDADLINQASPPAVENPWPRDAARKLILWAWSRKPEQVRFTSEAVNLTLKYAKELGRKYSPAIPLVQSESVRYKIARLAAAVAAKTFRTEDGEVVIVDEACVTFAVAFMQACYDKPSMSYNWFSDATHEDDEVDTDIVERILNKIGEAAGNQKSIDQFIRGMLATPSISTNDMVDFTGIDQYETKLMIGHLVRNGCIFKTGMVYRKKPGFIRVLRAIQARRASPEGPRMNGQVES